MVAGMKAEVGGMSRVKPCHTPTQGRGEEATPSRSMSGSRQNLRLRGSGRQVGRQAGPQASVKAVPVAVF